MRCRSAVCIIRELQAVPALRFFRLIPATPRRNPHSKLSMSSTLTKAPPKPRPKHLDLVKIRLPLPGWVSIMHRVSGAALFLCLPALLWLLDKSLTTEVGYDSLRGIFSLWWVKLPLFGLLWGYLHHFCAGIRYLFLDMHMGIDLASARMSAGIVYFVSVPLALLAGWRLFL